MIRDYIIQQKLGTGSYGVVYKVTKKSDKTQYVLKQISLFGLTPSQINDVKNESKILSQLKSIFVVKYYDSFEEKNFLNIVMEFCDGGDLGNFLEYEMKSSHMLKEDLIWRLFTEISLGLAYIHSQNILHRDLKALNIFLTKNLEVKIGDLGVAKILNHSNFAKTFIGTPYYLSPEICEERPYNNKSDVWALGCILYEMCTYRHPFNANSQGALILKILKGKYDPISSRYSSDLRNMIEKILDKNDYKRPNIFDILKLPILLEKAKKYGLLSYVLELCPDAVEKSKVSIAKAIAQDGMNSINNGNNNKEGNNGKGPMAQSPKPIAQKQKEEKVKVKKISPSKNKASKPGGGGVVDTGSVPKKQSANSKNKKIRIKTKDQPVKVIEEKKMTNMNHQIEAFEKVFKENESKRKDFNNDNKDKHQAKKIKGQEANEGIQPIQPIMQKPKQNQKEKDVNQIMDLRSTQFFEELNDLHVDIRKRPSESEKLINDFKKQNENNPDVLSISRFLMNNPDTSHIFNDVTSTNVFNPNNDNQNQERENSNSLLDELISNFSKILDTSQKTNQLGINNTPNFNLPLNDPIDQMEFNEINLNQYSNKEGEIGDCDAEINHETQQKAKGDKLIDEKQSSTNVSNDSFDFQVIENKGGFHHNNNDYSASDESLDEQVVQIQENGSNDDEDEYEEEGDEKVEEEYSNKDDDSPKLKQKPSRSKNKTTTEQEAKIKGKIEGLKLELKKLLGEEDSKKVLSIYQKLEMPQNVNSDDVCSQIEAFIKKKYPQKEEEFDNIYFQLLLCDCSLKKN